MGRPYFYRRESSLDYELADDPSTLSGANGETRLFSFQRNDTGEKADIKAIEEGLKWVVEKYRYWELKSLAMPALVPQRRPRVSDVGIPTFQVRMA
ncbi:MAG: hypothetical protein ACYC7D_13630 [Nitrososphaerales archaeon]